MNKLTKPQKEKVKQFASVANSTEKVAMDILKSMEWSVDAALDHFYNNPQLYVNVDTKALGALYAKYKDANEDLIRAEGVFRLCEDLKVDPGDPVTLVLSHKLGAATMCEYTKDEFVGGLARMGVDSLAKLVDKVGPLRAELKDDAKFRDVYAYAHAWAREKGQKSVAAETALDLWKLLLGREVRGWPLADHWCEFVGLEHNKAVSKDLWTQVLDFSRQIKPDLSNYDAEGAWPCLIDDFVTWLKAKRSGAGKA